MKKRFFCALLSMLFVLSMLSFTAFAETKKLDLINNKHTELNLINPIANVQYITDASPLSDDSVGGAMIKVSEQDDIVTLLAECIENNVIPTFWIDNEDEALAVADAMTRNTCNDANIISSDTAAIAKMREKKVRARTGLIVELESAVIDLDIANTIRESVRSAPATFCVINSDKASKQVVSELQKLAVAVWVKADAEPDTPEFVSESLRAVTSGANGIITKSSSALTNVINEYFAENTMTRTPVMIGHRGNPGVAPENTLSGFIKAYENGADVFEVDVEITKDGEIIIMHDNTLNRTTDYNGNKTVNQMTLEEVKECHILARDGSVTDERVPTLKEVLEEFKDKDCKIFVEFKGNNAANVPATAALIKEYGMQGKVDVISFNVNFLKTTQAELTGMATGYLHSPAVVGGNVTDALSALYPSLVQAQASNSTINPSRGVCNSYYTQAATDRGMTIWPWTYSLSTNNDGFLSGCDGVTTDDMQWVTNMVKYLGTSLEEGETNAVVELGADREFSVNAVTYGGAENEVSGDDLIVKYLSGEDCISVSDSTVKGIKEGKAEVLFGYKTKTANGSEYVVYTQPITFEVASVAPIVEKTNTELYIAIGIMVAAVVIGAAAIVVIKKKK